MAILDRKEIPKQEYEVYVKLLNTRVQKTPIPGKACFRKEREKLDLAKFDIFIFILCQQNIQKRCPLKTAPRKNSGRCQCYLSCLPMFQHHSHRVELQEVFRRINSSSNYRQTMRNSVQASSDLLHGPLHGLPHGHRHRHSFRRSGCTQIFVLFSIRHTLPPDLFYNERTKKSEEDQVYSEQKVFYSKIPR